MGLGVIFYSILSFIYYAESLNLCTSTINDIGCIGYLDRRFRIFYPFGMYKNEYLNIIFWILTVFIILSLIRYFKNKNKPASS